MEFLSDVRITRFKQDLAETYKDKINDLEKTFEENGYIALQPMNYINRNLTDIEIINNKNFNDDTARNIYTELAIDQFIKMVRQDITKDWDDQQKYTLYEINDCNKTFTVIIVAYDLVKELPTGSELI